MAKQDQRGRNKGESRHVRLYHWEMNGVAFQSLSPNAKAVYLELRRRFKGNNNGEISLSSREAGEVCHKSKSVGARAINELMEKGFLKCRRDSQFNMKHHLAREYELTAISTDKKLDGIFRKGSCEFMSWCPEKALKSPAQKTENGVVGGTYGVVGETPRSKKPVLRVV